jgi:hypothetical protein
MATVPEPMPEAVFDALMASAGIPLDPAGRTSVRAASALLGALTERLHRPRPVEVEPAPVFAPREARR